MVALVVLLVAPPLLVGFGRAAAWFDTLLSIVLLVAILSMAYERRQRIVVLVLGAPTIVASLGSHGLTGTAGSTASLGGHLCAVVFLFVAVGFVLRMLLRAKRITVDSLFGAVCGYLLLGVAWGVLYGAVETIRPGSFNTTALGQSADDPPRETYGLLYYSFVTLTTLGYGDVTPATPPSRTLSWVEAVTGQFYVAIVVAGLVSVLVTQAIAGRDPRQRDPRDDDRETPG